MTRRRPAVLATAVSLVAVAALSGCTGGGDEPDDDETTTEASETSAAPVPDVPTGPTYVALGDSYAAAPGVPVSDEAGGCYRSSSNYAHLLAVAEDLPLTDVTCSGATSVDVLADQVPSITAQTELVTVGIGGNDFDLFTTLISSCAQASAGDSGTPCTDAIGDDVDQTLEQIEGNLVRLLGAIEEAGPDAQIVVVGYPDLLPESGSCEEVPLAPGDYALVNSVTQRLSDLLEQAATETGFDFVDVGAASKGHDLCSDDPWVNGATTAEDGTVPFHPLAAEQEAVAGLIAQFLPS